MEWLDSLPDVPPQLREKLDFLASIEGLKRVERKTTLLDGSRRENSAEHSWHLAMLGLVLAEYANEPVDPLKLMKMLLVHDLGEIGAGDTFHYHKVGTEEGVEQQTITRLLAVLNNAQGQEISELWWEFHQGSSSEAKFARAIDRIWPIIQNLTAGGGTWSEYRVTPEILFEKNKHIAEGSLVLWQFVVSAINFAAERYLCADS